MYLGIPNPNLLPTWASAVERARPILRQAIAHAITITCWAIAITLTAGRLARRVYAWARPRLAQLLHQTALALDPGLVYPDQPEPTPPAQRLGASKPRARRHRARQHS